jgi:hypothetical protein
MEALYGGKMVRIITTRESDRIPISANKMMVVAQLNRQSLL